MHGIATVTLTPIIGLDLWEHAYFNQYEGDKERYIENFWGFVDWDKVSENFERFNLDNKVAPLLD